LNQNLQPFIGGYFQGADNFRAFFIVWAAMCGRG